MFRERNGRRKGAPLLALGPAVLLAAVLLSGVHRTPSLPAAADTTLYGIVTDADTGIPLAGCGISLNGLSHYPLTGSDGRYAVTLRAASYREGRVTLLATKSGYLPVARTVRLGPDSVRVDFALPPKAEARPLEELFDLARAGRKVEVNAMPAGALVSASRESQVPIFPGQGEGLPPFNTEEYDRIYENPFLAVDGNPLSTFSIDVDAASYSNVRRFLLDGALPPPDAVRIEELINYFGYEYPEPEAADPLSFTVEMMPAPWKPAHRLVRIGLQGRRIPTASLPPSHLVFLLDVSGSMDSPDKLPLLKSAFRMLVNQLRSEDRVSIVVYAGAAGLVLPPTPGNEKGRILEAIDRLSAGGSTAGGAGIQLAYKVARENWSRDTNTRVILATDGDFNIGVSSTSELIRLVESEREHGVYLTVLGFGTGNLKDGRMEQLADKGNGHYAYIDSILEAKKVLVNEMGATLVTVANDVKLQIEFNPTRVQAYRLIGYENRMLRAEDFNDDTKDAGELGAGHTVTALYEIVPTGVETDVRIRGVDSLRYRPNAPTPAVGPEDEWMAIKLRYKRPGESESRLLQSVLRDAPLAEASADFRFAAAVAAFGMLLRDSEFCGSATYDMVRALARGAVGPDAQGYRQEFLRLVEVAEAVDPDERPDEAG